ncbi:MAG: magnesium transporter CorA family protein [Patescibacteria group bacterium]
MPVLGLRKKQPADVSPARARTNVRKVSQGDLTWYDFAHPTEADVRYVERNFRFHPLDLADVRSTKQRPKLDSYEDYLFLIVHVPHFDRANRRLLQEEVDIFVNRTSLVTLHSGRIKPLSGLFAEVRRSAALREKHMGHGSGFLLYELISRLYAEGFPMLDKIAGRLNTLEQDILRGRKTKNAAEELSHLKLEIINFRRIIRPQRELVRQLETVKKRFLPDRLDVYFDDVHDSIERMSDLLENYREVAQSLEDTNETFIQHRTNNVVKMLTIISLITLPGATISGILAMNLRYPFPVNETTFFVTVGASLSAAVLLFTFMLYKRWL